MLGSTVLFAASTLVQFIVAFHKVRRELFPGLVKLLENWTYRRAKLPELVIKFVCFFLREIT